MEYKGDSHKMHTNEILFIQSNFLHISYIGRTQAGNKNNKNLFYPSLLTKHYYGHLNTTKSLLHPTYKERWMNALQNVYIQLFHLPSTVISEQTKKEGNPRFALIYDVQLKHSCAWSLSLSLPSIQSGLLCYLYLSTFTAYVFHWLPFYHPVPLFCN